MDRSGQTGVIDLTKASRPYRSQTYPTNFCSLANFEAIGRKAQAKFANGGELPFLKLLVFVAA